MLAFVDHIKLTLVTKNKNRSEQGYQRKKKGCVPHHP